MVEADLQSTLLAVVCHMCQSRRVWGAKSSLCQASHQLCLRWVRVHVGHDGIEKIDERTRRGVEGYKVHRVLPVPWSMVKSKLQEETERLQSPHCRQTQFCFFNGQRLTLPILNCTSDRWSWLKQVSATKLISPPVCFFINTLKTSVMAPSPS